jgi:hypothetical protein
MNSDSQPSDILDDIFSANIDETAEKCPGL